MHKCGPSLGRARSLPSPEGGGRSFCYSQSTGLPLALATLRYTQIERRRSAASGENPNPAYRKARNSSADFLTNW